MVVGAGVGVERVYLKLFCLTSKKESTLRGKNLLPIRANSFLLK